jgi:hypothetical protein
MEPSPAGSGFSSYLATSFVNAGGLPVAASITRMSRVIGEKLAAIGLHEPVSLRSLPGKYWQANIDASFENPSMESGCAYVVRSVTSERLSMISGACYTEVTAGPFDSLEEMNPCYFVEAGFDRKKLDEGALLCKMPNWIISRLAEKGFREPIPFADLAGRYWVSGMSYVCSTTSIERALRAGDFEWHITDGPFDNEVDAFYQFDCNWESPE